VVASCGFDYISLITNCVEMSEMTDLSPKWIKREEAKNTLGIPYGGRCQPWIDLSKYKDEFEKND